MYICYLLLSLWTFFVLYVCMYVLWLLLLIIFMMCCFHSWISLCMYCFHRWRFSAALLSLLFCICSLAFIVDILCIASTVDFRCTVWVSLLIFLWCIVFTLDYFPLACFHFCLSLYCFHRWLFCSVFSSLLSFFVCITLTVDFRLLCGFHCWYFTGVLLSLVDFPWTGSSLFVLQQFRCCLIFNSLKIFTAHFRHNTKSCFSQGFWLSVLNFNMLYLLVLCMACKLSGK
jgi:hypothetical protein